MLGPAPTTTIPTEPLGYQLPLMAYRCGNFDIEDLVATFAVVVFIAPMTVAAAQLIASSFIAPAIIENSAMSIAFLSGNHRGHVFQSISRF